MYNLLVTGSTGWTPSRDSMSIGRTLEWTDQHVRERFFPDRVLDLRAVTQIPTVFACETGWDTKQPAARVGTLTRVTATSKEYQFDYVLDPDIPPIPNSVLFGPAARSLHINITDSIPESSRNHWAIKDVDLYKELLKIGADTRLKPKVFSFSDEPVDETLVAVMMPFEARFDPVYSTLKAAIADAGLVCRRADDIWENDHVIQDVALLLSTASIVICDLSDRNANVFYETGIAHALGREVVLIAQSAKDIPFDVAAIRYISYHHNGEGLAKLAKDLSRRIETLKDRIKS